MNMKMRGFHIDMNIGRFRADYLRNWLKKLRDFGYNSILWEVENNIQWEACPQCAANDAFTKKEFKELLDYCNDLGLESIPVLQTLGHCEYVLKHKEFKHLAELPERIDQYCPSNPDLHKFLFKWIDEYLELFSDTKRFHIGADEAWSMGKCPKCKEYVEKNSLSELYINYINPIGKYLLEKGIQPIIWADMVLHYPEALDMLSRDIMLFDFMYDTHCGSGQVWVWDRDCNFGSSGLKTKGQLDEWTLKQFGEYLFSDKPGHLETFYTADYLADKGFKVSTCPSSCSYPDNIFAPKTILHMRNTFDSFKKGKSEHLKGSMLTSWTMHLLPWELQVPSIEIVSFLISNPESSFEDYLKFYSEGHFGLNDNSFFDVCELLSKGCLFTHHPTLGFDKSGFPVAGDHVDKIICRIKDEDQIKAEFDNCLARINDYSKAMEILYQLLNTVSKGQKELEYWCLAAENLTNRAKASACILAFNSNGKLKLTIKPDTILTELQVLKQKTKQFYMDKLKQDCVDYYIHSIYDSIENYLNKI